MSVLLALILAAPIPCGNSVYSSPSAVQSCSPSEVSPLVNFQFGTPMGAPRLPSAITIEGATVQPSIECYGSDATATEWVCLGETLQFFEGGGDIALNQGSPWGDGTGVEFDEGDAYMGSDPSVFNITTGDYILHFVIRTDIVLAERRFFSKFSTGQSRGIVGRVTNAGAISIYIQGDDSNTSIITADGILAAGAYYDIIVIADSGG
jgi:hypothetical protein